MHTVFRDVLEGNLLSNYTCHVKDSTELPRESSAESSLTTGLWSLGSTGALEWLESHQWLKMLYVSVFERERRERAMRNCVEFSPLLTNLTPYLYQNYQHHHHPHLQGLPKYLVHTLPNSLYIYPKYTPKLFRIGRTNCLPNLIIICPKRSFKHLIKPVALGEDVSHVARTAHWSRALCQP